MAPTSTQTHRSRRFLCPPPFVASPSFLGCGPSCTEAAMTGIHFYFYFSINLKICSLSPPALCHPRCNRLTLLVSLQRPYLRHPLAAALARLLWLRRSLVERSPIPRLGIRLSKWSPQSSFPRCALATLLLRGPACQARRRYNFRSSTVFPTIGLPNHLSDRSIHHPSDHPSPPPVDGFPDCWHAGLLVGWLTTTSLVGSLINSVR